jgi:hypothetical protein
MRLLIAAFALAFAVPAQAEILLSEVTGNWAGQAGGGFYFRAVLTQEEDRARLRIWQDLNGVPEGGDPQFDNGEIALGAFTTLQELRLRETGEGTVMTVFTGFADETGSGREVVDIRYMDNQFTVVGYRLELDAVSMDVELPPSTCVVDLLNGFLTVDNVDSEFAVPAFEDLNATGWYPGAAIAKGYCLVAE